MPPGVRRSIAATAAVLLLATLAATSASRPLWVVPDVQTVDPAGVPSQPVPSRGEAAPTDSADLPALSGSWFDAIGVVLVALLAVGAAVALWNQRFAGAGRGIRLPRRRRHHSLEPDVPDADDGLGPAAVVVIDGVAARAALERGEARNAVVACWMQLERDVAAIGLRRLDAETSSEFARRVIRAASLDPGPIDSLAAQYRRARFSRHPLDDGDRAAALATLDEVVAALPERRRSSGVAT